MLRFSLVSSTVFCFASLTILALSVNLKRRYYCIYQVHYNWINASNQGEIAGYNLAGIERSFREEYATEDIEMYEMNMLSRWMNKK
ncbi:MAG: hypothetical protein ACE14V_03605 [bacterium]